MRDIEHLDTKQYEDLKSEYIRRKMAKSTKAEDDASLGGSTRYTERDDEESRKGAFSKAMGYFFNEPKKDVPRVDGI